MISVSGVQNLEFSASFSADSLPQDIEAVKDYNILNNKFGRGESIVVSLRVDDISKTTDLRDPEVVKATHRFSEYVRDHDFVRNAFFYSDIVYRVLGRPPRSKEQVKMVLSKYPELDQMMNSDYSMTTINVQGDVGWDMKSLNSAMKDISRSIENAGFPPGVEVTTTGFIPIYQKVMSLLRSDLTKMMIIALILIFSTLLFFYRGIIRSLIPILPLVIAIILTVGLISLIGMKINPASVSIGALLVGMGIDYGVHVFNRYYEERKKGKDPEGSINKGVSSVSKAIIGTSATTIVGFASLYASRLSFMKNLSKTLVIGISLTMISALVILPTIILYEEKIRKKFTGEYETPVLVIHKGKIENFFIKISRLIENNYKLIIALFFVGTLFMSYGATKMRMQTKMEELLPEDMEEIQVLDQIRSELGGESTTTVLIQSKNGRDVRDAELMKKIKLMQKLLKKESYDTKVSTIDSTTYLMKEIPDQDSKVKQILSQSPTSHRYISDDYSVLRITLYGNFMGGSVQERSRILKDIRQTTKRINLPSGYEVSITGSQVLDDAMAEVSQEDMNMISLIGFLGIIIVVLLLFRSFTDSIIMAIPMIVGSIWTVGFVGYIGIPINQFLIGFFSMLLGLGIDFGMHITHRYRESKSVQKTLTSVGPGILTGGLTTIFGYLALLSGSLPMLHSLGIILAIGILSMMFAAFMLTPSFIKLKEEYKGGKKDETKKSKK